MGISRGTNIITDGLVFGYDNGHNDNITGLDSQPHHNDYRFYKGIPATNVISSGIPGYFGSGGVTSYQKTMHGFTSASGVFQRNFVNNPAQENTGTYNNNAGLYHSGLSFNSLSASTEYVMVSFDFYMITPYVRHSSSGTGLNGYMGITYTDGTSDNHGWNTSLAGNAGDDWNNNSAYVGKWRKIALICDVRDDKTPSSINAMYIYNDRTIQGEGIFTNFVITEHTTLPTAPAQWIAQNGSRGNTDCLIDLKRTENISVANVSFDSTGQPEFDGTDDIIEVSRQIDTANYSSEFVFKASVNTSGTEHWLGAQYIAATGRIVFDLYTDNTLRNFISGTSITGGTTIATGVWYHAVFTRDSSGAAKIYLNGAQDATGTVSTATPLNTNFQIGGSTVLNSKEFTGNIAVVKVYNKVLSATEVTQNYNAYKNRFNL